MYGAGYPCMVSTGNLFPLTRCLNPETGAITPQFNIVFDDSFTTARASVDTLPDFGSGAWMKLFGNSTYQHVVDDGEQAAATDASTIDDEPKEEFHRPPQPLPVVPSPTKLKHVPPAPAPSGELSSQGRQREPFFQTEHTLPPIDESPSVPNARSSPPQREKIGEAPKPCSSWIRVTSRPGVLLKVD
mmetsp:Transcript_18631/g.46123  ORF Transcript_18631/g.46123 Transcript_18631/m.46123 type:complete len:187 (+) Transcript_18631:794-1354(+)